MKIQIDLSVSLDLQLLHITHSSFPALIDTVALKSFAPLPLSKLSQ
jgi:hypothetical protein